MGAPRILHVASEYAPHSQTGGLGDVARALPQAMAQLTPSPIGVVTPLYKSAAQSLVAKGLARELVYEGRVNLPGQPPVAVQAWQIADGPVTTYWVDCPVMFHRDGGLYGPTADKGFDDNLVRFAVFGRVVVALCKQLGTVELLHGHDWQAALALAYAAMGETTRDIARIITVHNLAFQGQAPLAYARSLGLPEAWLTHHAFEHWGRLNVLKGGIALAHAMATVSPAYAEEILTPEFGEGLHEFLRWDVSRRVGITNGIDEAAWDPSHDELLASPYSAGRIEGKAACKAALLAAHFPQANPTDMVAGVVSRLTTQKGLDWLCECVPHLAELGIRLIVLGTGDAALESRLSYLATAFSHHLRFVRGFDPRLAHQIYAAADVFVMPSRFEPCGLGQLYAMRYGAIPVVAAVGGLRDTVIDASDDDEAVGTGFTFAPRDATALLLQLRRARTRFANKTTWLHLVARAMGRDSSWRAPALSYLQLYRQVGEET